jgi:ABC-type sugar transport system substrate-binding protein
MMALIAGTGAAQIAAVSAQQYTPKTFQDGGTIVGASHSDGGVPFTVAGQAGFEAEGGEYIFSRSTVDRLGTGLLDAINFGGASPRLFADGGSVARKSMESVAMAQVDMAEQIGDTIALRITEIPVVNVAQETVDTSRLVENAAAMARL